MRLLSPAQIHRFPPPKWLVRNILLHHSFGELYGPPGIGKSFLALDLAHSVGTGIQWLDNDVEQGSVVYVVAGEGVYGVRKRLEAWEHRRKLRVEHVKYLCEAVQLHQAHSVQKFRKAIRHEHPKLIVFDTLARCTAGADENTGKDMGGIVGAIDALRDDFDTAVLVVHHTGRPNAEGETHDRGWSGLPGALDMQMEVVLDQGRCRTIWCRKQKEARDFYPIHCELREVAKRGDVVSLVPEPSLRPITETARGVPRTPPVPYSKWRHR